MSLTMHGHKLNDKDFDSNSSWSWNVTQLLGMGFKSQRNEGGMGRSLQICSIKHF